MADVTITITAGPITVTKKIPDAKLADFRAGFLAKIPVPQIQDPDWVDPEDGTPPDMINAYSDLQHFANVLEDYYKQVHFTGKKWLAKQATVIDDDIIIDG